MLTRKPSILIASYSTVVNGSTIATSSTSSKCASTRAARNITPPHDHCRIAHKRYASIAGDCTNPSRKRNNHHLSEHDWPEAQRGQPYPTPYQIFSMKADAEYSKARYYELVKMYHPDLNNSAVKTHISPQTRIERYRLVVAAHSILSDPVRRNAYDRYGAGWTGKVEPGVRESHNTASAGPFSQNWTAPDDPIWTNATWEDWEKYYTKRNGGRNPYGRHPESRGGPLYMQNSYFVTLVALLALIGGSINYNIAQDAGIQFIERRDLVHDRTAKHLRQVRQESLGMTGRDERVDFFLRQRDAMLRPTHATDIEALREERANRLLRDKEVCQSEGIQTKRE